MKLTEFQSSKRAIRRHDPERVIRQRLRRTHRHVKNPGHLFKNNTVCSCWMCGNPRKHLGEVTLQEKKFREAWPILWEDLALEAENDGARLYSST
ncbi:MAG: hypothetical protein FJ110_05310 [Deltaproteobacteria bacterium]|nr:hypothetical protein [Deltaproteobacteria bacterium]